MPEPKSPQPAPPQGELSKAYKPSEHEDRIRARWDAARAFHVDPARADRAATPNPSPDAARRPPYAIVIPPPNVTAALHLGHALNNTLQDVLTRAHRMMGYETLWMPGTDHAGIATQTVVEKRLIASEGRKRTEYQRDDFVEKVQAFKDEYEAVITGQLKAMGCSCDWDRQRFTMDDICAKAVREAFFRMFRDGLIYRGKRLVNWDPATQTVLADDEVENEEVDGNFYYLRYPLCDAEGRDVKVKLGDGDPVDHITVATTRPETFLGDTAVAVNPRDPRWPTLRESNAHVRLPFVGRVIPIVADDYVVMPAQRARSASDGSPSLSDANAGETHSLALGARQDAPGEKIDPKALFATGFLKVTPAHDTNDYALWQRHKDEMPGGLINVMAPDASISDKHGWTDVGDAAKWVGLSREDARREIVKAFKAAGLCENVKPYRHSVGHSYRSHVAIEPYLSDQWYIAVKKQIPSMPDAGLIAGTDVPVHSMAGLALQPLLDGDLKFVPERYAKTYQTWLENLRDWPISRQLWWGHRIPVWSRHLTIGPDDPDGPAPAWVETVCNGLDHAMEDTADCSREYAGIVVDSATGRPLNFQEFDELCTREGVTETLHFDAHLCIKSPELIAYYEERGFVRDPDVLDTWFSSGLWPLSTMGWPEPEQSPDTARMLAAFNPTDVLCTAREIITLWVSRMVMFNRYLLAASATAARAGAPIAPAPPDARRDREGALPSLLPGPLPYRDVFIHAMIQDGEGRKMSKSLGNGVDPLDIIATHGADAMRFTLCHMTTQTQDVRMPVSRDANGKNTSPKFDLGRNFCNKLWNAARFAISILEDAPSERARSASDGSRASEDLRHGETRSLALGARPDRPLADRWMLSRLSASASQIDACLKNYEYADYAATIYDLLWRDFCDWYLEAIKPTVKTDTPEGASNRAVLRATLDCILRLLHPICPFITEAIYERVRVLPTFGAIPGLSLAHHPSGLLCQAPWPHIAGDLRDADAESRFETLRALIDAIREARSQQNVAPKRRITLHLGAGADLAGAIASASGLVETLAGLERVTTDAPPAGAPFSTLAVGGVEHRLSNMVDAAAGAEGAAGERDRLTKKLEELAKSIAALEGRLNNPGYADRAPAKLVQQTRDQLAAQQAERESTAAALGRLG